MAGHWRTCSLAGALVALPALATGQPVVVRPGAVLAWRGAAATACEQDGRRSLPLDGVCYVAIDLLASGE